MKLCSINCETKSHNLPLATYILEKIIFHALIYTISFYWVASCEVSIKSTEDGWGSHLKSKNTNHRYICLLGRKMFHESQFLQLQLNYFCKAPEKKLLRSWFSCIYPLGWLPWSWAPPNLHLLLPNTWANQDTKGSLSSRAGILNNHSDTVTLCTHSTWLWSPWRHREFTASFLCGRAIYCHPCPVQGLDAMVDWARQKADERKVLPRPVPCELCPGRAGRELTQPRSCGDTVLVGWPEDSPTWLQAARSQTALHLLPSEQRWRKQREEMCSENVF